MIIKRYVVNNMNEAMVRIKYELGVNAIIVSQRKIRKSGIKGFFSKRLLEVTAAIDSERKAEREHSENDLIREVHDMKTMLKNVISLSNNEKSPENKNKDVLKQFDISEKNIEEILLHFNLIEEVIDENQKLKLSIKNMIKVKGDLKPRIMVMVGPTGVGKTTTIAKLAGRFSLYDNLKVGLITIDTYRIGAVDQLRTYAEIMNLPFKVVMSIKEMEVAVDNLKECDVILIDTTGRNSKNAMQISELRAYIDKIKADSINLVMSCTTKNSDIDVITKGYRELNYNSIIITKLDETSTYGSILNIIESAGKPLSYLTTGQNVPDDIKIMGADELSSLILEVNSLCLTRQIN